MYPGIPEYFNRRGRGVYPYLTGSASWYLMTMLTEAYGVRGEFGDLVLAPKLLACQFDVEGQTTVRTLFAGKELQVTYQKQQDLDYGQYKIGRMLVNGQPFDAETIPNGVKLRRHALEALPEQVEILVELERKEA
jgi:cellobiose phosphorylase